MNFSVNIMGCRGIGQIVRLSGFGYEAWKNLTELYIILSDSHPRFRVTSTASSRLLREPYAYHSTSLAPSNHTEHEETPVLKSPGSAPPTLLRE